MAAKGVHLPGCTALLYVSFLSKQQSQRYPGLILILKKSQSKARGDLDPRIISDFMNLELVSKRLSNLLSARSLLSHSIKAAARDGPCAHGKLKQLLGKVLLAML